MRPEAAARVWPFVFLLLTAGRSDGERSRLAQGAWAVKVAGGDREVADSVASAAGLRNSGLLDPFSDVFLFEGGEETEGGRKVARREALDGHSLVVWVSEQRPLRRVKRGFPPSTEVGSGQPREDECLSVFSCSLVLHRLGWLMVLTTPMTSPPRL